MQDLPKLAVPLAALLPRLDLEPQVQAWLAPLRTAAEGVELLQARGRDREALQLVAHALPIREAVWWACMCAASVAGPALPPAEQQAAAAAEHWVRHAQDDAARRRAGDAALASSMRSPQAWAAMAAFWSGGSLAPLGQPAVPPAPQLLGRAVAGSVLLAAVQGDAVRGAERMKRFLQSARDIAAGGAGRLAGEATS